MSDIIIDLQVLRRQEQARHRHSIWNLKDTGGKHLFNVVRCIYLERLYIYIGNAPLRQLNDTCNGIYVS